MIVVVKGDFEFILGMVLFLIGCLNVKIDI